MNVLSQDIQKSEHYRQTDATENITVPHLPVVIVWMLYLLLLNLTVEPLLSFLYRLKNWLHHHRNLPDDGRKSYLR